MTNTTDPQAHDQYSTLTPLADNLGVSVESLARLGVTSNGGTRHIPERNGDGE